MKLLHRLSGFVLALVLGTAQALAASPLTTSYGAAVVEGFDTSGVYDAKDTYMLNNVEWEANLLPVTPIYARSFGLSFFDVLVTAFPSTAARTYQSAANELSAGSIVVKTYDVLGTENSVGAAMHARYVPALNDPSTDIHWIQVIRNNHSLSGAHGTEDFKVDNLGAATPYYDTDGAANDRNFFDEPLRDDGGESHIWIAQLLLVSGPVDGNGAITFLGGLTWGWENHAVRGALATFSTPLDISITPVPEPHTYALMVGGLALLVVIARRNNRRAQARGQSAGRGKTQPTMRQDA
mgnify:CR=1 FL=1